MTGCPEILLQAIVGTRQLLERIASKQPAPIAGRDLAEVGDGCCQLTQAFLLLRHGREELPILLFEPCFLLVLCMSQQMGGLVEPVIGLLDGRPEGFCLLESFLDESLELG
jgi:hypothetical protein